MSPKRSGADTVGGRSVRWLLDVSPILAVVLLLVGVHSLPEPIQRQFVFEYGAPTLVTAYTAHFVHFSGSHLLTNLVAFVLVSGTIYVLAVRAGRRRLFFSFVVTLFVAFPLALSALNLAVPRDGVTYGFSGMNMALVGFLPIVVASYLERRLGRPIDGVILLLVFVSSVGYVAVIALPWSTYGGDLVLLSGGVVVALAAGYGYASEGLAPLRTSLDRCGNSKPLLVVAAGVWIVLLSAGFPRTVATGETVINIYTHFLGYALGFTMAYLTYEWRLADDGWRPESIPE